MPIWFLKRFERIGTAERRYLRTTFPEARRAVFEKSQYSGMFGDYSSFSEEYDELDDASLLDEEESEDEE